jgi:DNA-binding XRE family transcriptional regulator
MAKQPTCPNCTVPLVCLPCERMNRGKAAHEFRFARERAGIGLREMARRLGKSPTYLNQFETGKTPGHTLKAAYLAELAKAAGQPPREGR